MLQGENSNVRARLLGPAPVFMTAEMVEKAVFLSQYKYIDQSVLAVYILHPNPSLDVQYNTFITDLMHV